MSTTIHITTVDERMTLAILATLLNQPGVTISIDLDEMFLTEPTYDPMSNLDVKRVPASTKRTTDARKTKAMPLDIPRTPDDIANELWGPGSVAQENIRKAERKAKAAARKAVRERQLRENPEHLEWMQKMRDQRRDEMIQATQTTACPTCLVTVFESCKTAGGSRYPHGNCHIGRVRAMQADQGADSAVPAVW